MACLTRRSSSWMVYWVLVLAVEAIWLMLLAEELTIGRGWTIYLTAMNHFATAQEKLYGCSFLLLTGCSDDDNDDHGNDLRLFFFFPRFPLVKI